MMEFLPYIAGQITQPFNLVLMFGATVIGLIFGAIPGLSGTLAVMLFMPLTYTMNASSAVVFLIALWVGGCSGAFIGSVLLGIPGSASAVATCFDGYPMAQAGKAGKALAIGMVASFLGTFFSAILGALLSQKIADIAFALGPWEYFSLCFVAFPRGICLRDWLPRPSACCLPLWDILPLMQSPGLCSATCTL